MSSVSIIDARYPDVVEIARHMRELDAEEIWPVTYAKTPESLALGTVAGVGLRYVARCGAEGSKRLDVRHRQMAESGAQCNAPYKPGGNADVD